MDEQRFHRVFDQVKPSQSQKEAMLNRLLEPERKGKPMKKLRKLTVIGIAAALMIVTCAAAVVTGLDQRLLDYFGAGPEQAELLTSGAVPVDVTVEDNGATLHVTQVLMDRYTIMVLADFTAPEGTVLDMEENVGIDQGFGGGDRSVPELLDESEHQIDPNQGWAWYTEVLNDGNPLDNHLTLLLHMELDEGIQPDWNISSLSLHNRDLVRFDMENCQYITVYSGDWSCQVPVTWQDMGQSIRPNQVVGELDDIDITLTELYLSPMTLWLQLESETPIPRQLGGEIGTRWRQLVNNPTLTTKDGQNVALRELGCFSSDQEQNYSFRLDEITALEALEGGTLTLEIEGKSVDIPLDNLCPVE